MPPQRDQHSGQYTASYSDDEFIETLAELGGEATASEVADQIGCVRDSAYRRLDQLTENGDILKRQAGRIMVWRLAENQQ